MAEKLKIWLVRRRKTKTGKAFPMLASLDEPITKKADPLRAVDQLKKTFGDYAPEKVEHTHNGLEKLFGARKPAPGLEHDSHG